jgi:Phospholipase_D-nuclease N-terminal
MRDKERTLAREKRREARGKKTPRGASFPGTAEHPLQRKQVFAAALKRVNREIDRMHKLETRAAHVEAARRALAARRAAQFPPRPPSGDTASEGMRALPSRRRRTRVPPARIGNESQATKNAQAARDARNRSGQWTRRTAMLFVAEGFTFRNFLTDVFAVFMFILWFWLLIIVIGDLFRRHDISGWVKAIWVIALIVFPYLGIFAYMITQSRGIAERSSQQAVQTREELRRVVGFSVADEIEKLDRLKKSGSITDQEFTRLRAKLVA